jgi:cytochrome c oxidase assembly protein subunit 15
MIGLLVTQILLGAVVVIVDLPSLIITLHLLVAFLFMAILIFLWRAVGKGEGAWIEVKSNTRKIYGFGRSGSDIRTLRHVDIICVLLLATVALGGYIKHQQYGLTCGWLSCYDSFLPAGVAQWLQFSHRLAAVVTAVYIVWFALRSCVDSRNLGLQGRSSIAAIVVVVQVLLGIAAILTSLDIAWAVGHLAAATALFAIAAETRIYLAFYHDEGRNVR